MLYSCTRVATVGVKGLRIIATRRGTYRLTSQVSVAHQQT